MHVIVRVGVPILFLIFLVSELGYRIIEKKIKFPFYCGVYSLWVCNRICFGNNKMIFVKDLNRFEFLILFFLCILMFIFGILSTLVTDYTNTVFYQLINFIDIKYM
jgi:NADH:ubiquinone oxidoreductase subunit 4 (subunit M)